MVLSLVLLGSMSMDFLLWLVLWTGLHGAVTRSSSGHFYVASLQQPCVTVTGTLVDGPSLTVQLFFDNRSSPWGDTPPVQVLRWVDLHSRLLGQVPYGLGYKFPLQFRICILILL